MSVYGPVVASKTLGPSWVLEFMGIELDTTRMEARLPKDKLQHTRDLLHSFAKRRFVRLVELQSLIGTLQFACKAVVPGRTFLQRMITWQTRNFSKIWQCGKLLSLGGMGVMYLGFLPKLLMPFHAFRTHVSGTRLPRPKKTPSPSRLH